MNLGCDFKSNIGVEYQCEIKDIKEISGDKIKIHKVYKNGKDYEVDFIELNKITKLTVMCRMEDNIPDEVGKLVNLNKLTLATGNYSTLPKEFRNLRKLTNLILINPNITKLPIFVYELPNLKNLSIMYNVSTFEFQEELCMADINIKVITMGSNLKTIPNCLLESGKIEFLY